MDTDITELLDDQSRRSVLKKGAVSVGALSLGAGAATAQSGEEGTNGGNQTGTDGEDGLGDEFQKALMYVGQARPGSRFVITSPVIDWTPQIEEIRDNIWSNYNTRVARYLNTDEQVMFWVAQEAELPEFDEQVGYVVDAEGDTSQGGTPQPEVYQFHTEWSPFGDAAFVTVNFAPVGEDEEDDFLDLDDWWLDDGDDTSANGGTDGGTNGGGNATNGGTS